MEDFQYSLDSVMAIPGVEGLCILHDRKIALRDFQESIEDQCLIHLGQELRDLQTALVINKMGTPLIYIYFEEKKIFFYPLADKIDIIVFCSEDINPKLIEMHFQVARNSLLDWLGKDSKLLVKDGHIAPQLSDTPLSKEDAPQEKEEEELSSIDPALNYKLQYIFREFMGPIAGILWKKTANKWLSQHEKGDLKELIMLMSKEFQEKKDKEGFLQKAEALLKDHGYK